MKLFNIFVLMFVLLSFSEAKANNSCNSELSGVINTPADDSVHCVIDSSTCKNNVCQCDPNQLSPYSLEWWYWSGHLTADNGHKFGFAQIVYTGIDLTSFTPIQWSDTTISDLSL